MSELLEVGGLGLFTVCKRAGNDYLGVLEQAAGALRNLAVHNASQVARAAAGSIHCRQHPRLRSAHAIK